MYTEHRRPISGFTLIELLVVIAIIAILAAIMFPIFLRAKLTAIRLSCLNQHRQIWQAVKSYGDDNDGRMPAAMYNILKPGGQPFWANRCCKYFGASNISFSRWTLARCPATDRKDKYGIWDPKSGYCWWWNWGLLITPGYNHVYLSPYDLEGWPHPINVADVGRPSRTVMLADSGNASYGYFVIEAPTGVSRTSAYTYGGWKYNENGIVAGRHFGTTNVIWVDGHSASMPVKQLGDDSLWDLK